MFASPRTRRVLALVVWLYTEDFGRSDNDLNPNVVLSKKITGPADRSDYPGRGV